MPKKKRIDPIPEEFASYEEAAEFWDTHDSMDYPDAFQTVKNVVVKLRKRRYEIEVDEQIAKMLQAVAQRQKKTMSQVASEILRRGLAAPCK